MSSAALNGVGMSLIPVHRLLQGYSRLADVAGPQTHKIINLLSGENAKRLGRDTHDVLQSHEGVAADQFILGSLGKEELDLLRKLSRHQPPGIGAARVHEPFGIDREEGSPVWPHTLRNQSQAFEKLLARVASADHAGGWQSVPPSHGLWGRRP